jgi:hypothetical protein
MSQYSKAWELKRIHLLATVREFERRSRVLRVLNVMDFGDEWRAVLQFVTRTYVQAPGEIAPRLEGPITVGVRYHHSFLFQAPLPAEMAGVLAPLNIFHPNIHPVTGGVCLGELGPNYPLASVLHQVWCGLTYQMRIVRTDHAFNWEAAAFVRARIDALPLDRRGLFEATPDPSLETIHASHLES